MRQCAILILTFAGVAGLRAEESARMTDRQLVTALQKGGYVVFVRHPKTNPDQADTDPLHLENIQAQRQLSDEGRQQARAIGKAMRALKIPVERVIASKFNRTFETAKLLDVGEVTTSLDVTYGGKAFSQDENTRRTQALRQLLATPPPAGKNTLIVSHKPNLVDAAGKEFADSAEGETVVFQPLGEGKFKVAGRIEAEKWSELGKQP